MPLAGRAFVDEDIDILESLGLHHGPDQLPEHSKRVYLGIELEQERVLPTFKKADSSSEKKKPARMYRGQSLVN